ncbi:hypothetical protein AMAG_20109 [Allomyces macrogynus ATCC 38327]|uniref:Uncharacterized protein n=1 Tax=Allomyces macrogynus (strain ATCC 38327) TaxID=578462 RepID=A0A0L0T6J4_ALLM3|nr:hypothetical protein AMAG_20109 [Allomyces macrogynus ATCC 38327]|eukprot:KNE70423.1 hypothetical protein AMAG_20109 [Allomyces macrogynus ATCC 38327]
MTIKDNADMKLFKRNSDDCTLHAHNSVLDDLANNDAISLSGEGRKRLTRAFLKHIKPEDFLNLIKTDRALKSDSGERAHNWGERGRKWCNDFVLAVAPEMAHLEFNAIKSLFKGGLCGQTCVCAIQQQQR